MPFSFKDISKKCIETLNNLPDDKEYVALIRGGEYFPVENLSISNDKIKIETSILQPGDIIFHTHNEEYQHGWFSDIDIKSSLLVGYPILLYHTKFKVWDYYDPNYPHPYPLGISSPVLTETNFLKITYSPVRSDCYSFARNFREAIFDKSMRDIYRENPNPEFWYPKFTDVEKLGFVKMEGDLTTVQPGDIVLVKISPKMPFHVIIAIDEKKGIHQLTKHSEYCYLPDFAPNLIGIYGYSAQ